MGPRTSATKREVPSGFEGVLSSRGGRAVTPHLLGGRKRRGPSSIPEEGKGGDQKLSYFINSRKWGKAVFDARE